MTSTPLTGERRSLTKESELHIRQYKSGRDAGHIRSSGGRRFAGIVFLSLALCSLANYVFAHWLGLSPTAAWRERPQDLGIYRRIGPQSDSQVFCAGSSLLLWGVSWPKVSEVLNNGIENWSVGGSSPEIWEVFQQRRPTPALTVIGVSVYDLNEMRLTPERAKYVPLTETIDDLWATKADTALSRRILTQYFMRYMRFVFPMAGDSDKVLIAARRKLAQVLGLERSLDEHEGVVPERDGVLDAGEYRVKVSDWSSARVLRRLAALRAENHGVHEFFRGPKIRAFERILQRARQRGPVIVVVLPVSKWYTQEFIDKSTSEAFERALSQVMKTAPDTKLVRLDQVPGIDDDSNFADLAHLNFYGRLLTTPVFLRDIAEVEQGENLKR